MCKVASFSLSTASSPFLPLFLPWILVHTFSLPSLVFQGHTTQVCIPRAAFNHTFSLLRIRIVNFILQNTVTPDLGKGTGPAEVMLSLDLQQGSCPAAGTGIPSCLAAPGEDAGGGRKAGCSSDK